MLSKAHLSKLTILLVLALIQTGCSISASVESSSDSISTSLESITSISTSSSGSSEDDEKEKVEQTTSLYEEDIAALTVLYVRNQNDDEFKRQITDTAGTHGINDWEQEAATFNAMGVGLKRAGISEDEIKTMPYFQDMNKKSQYNQVMEGFKN